MFLLLTLIICVQIRSPGTINIYKYDQSKYYIYEDLLLNDIYQWSGVKLPKTYDINHLILIDKQADKLNIPKKIIYRLVFKESNFNQHAISICNAYSYMQVIPSTFSKYSKIINYSGKHTPEINIIIGTQLLSDLYSYWIKRCNTEGTAWILALASYNAGKGAVIEYGGVPPYKETLNYIKFIMDEN